MRHVHIAATRDRLLREAREADYTAWQQMAAMIGLNVWAHWRYSPWMRHANRRHQQPLGNLFLERARRQKGVMHRPSPRDRPLDVWTHEENTMRRFLTALILGLMLTGLVAVPAMAAPPDPCVAGVTVSTFTDSDTGNVIQVTTTTTCNDDGTVDDISYEYETLMYWVTSKRDGRAGGHYETPAERLTPPGPFMGYGPPRARDVCN